jgi:hypothetical protein
MSQKSTANARSTSMGRIVVTPAKDGWQLKRDGAAHATSVFSTQAAATEAAKAQLRVEGGELRIQSRDGRWRETFTLGEKAMTKVAAVEGIQFTPAMMRKMKALDTPGLTIEERRRILMDAPPAPRR